MSQSNDFVHLHVHTQYSLNDAMAKIKNLIKRAKELGQKAIAITDHGNMFGVVEFYKEAKKNDIKPIIGCEMYICPPGKHVKVRDNRHIVLLAKNKTGYYNLMQIMSEAAVDGFYYNARTDYDTLRKYSDGLICLTACLGGDLAKTIELEGYEAGKEKLMLYVDIFGEDNVYIEIQDNGMKDQYEMNKKLIRLSEETGIPLVATNDVHYIKREDAFYHDALMALQAKTTIDDTKNRKVYESDEFYLKSYDEMNTGRLPIEALENTVKIAERCSFELEFGKLHIPEFKPPKGFENSYEFLRYLAYKGLSERYPGYENDPEWKKKIVDRIEYELDVINRMRYVDYFLIVWDFVRFAYENDIWDGPGRGSAAGSLLAYSLYITDIEPFEHGLIFERFLNPSRVTMPDIDWDIQDSKRHLVIDYVIKKYGHTKVCQIITFGTYAARAAVRAAGRALGTKRVPYMTVDKVAKAIPAILGITIDEALETNKDLRGLYESDENIRLLIDTARAIEGLPSHTSTHAAGVLITPDDVTNYVPLWVNDGVVVAQFDMVTLEELGLLKMDFLGLTTLSVIADTVKWAEINHGVKLTKQDLLNAVYDPDAYKMICKGYTDGVFQLEGAGMTRTAVEMQPKDVKEVTALVSLYRPGPMQYIPQYIENKKNPKNITYPFEGIEDILEETYGILCYQEQVMFLSQRMCGYSMAFADELRKAIGKKKEELIAEHREYFIYGKEENNQLVVPGATRKGYDEARLIDFYDNTITPFGRYCFNKSHGASYAYLAAQTSWLKLKFPVEFMASLLTHNSDTLSKVARYLRHCEKDLSIEIIPPNVNQSTHEFVPTKDGKIIYSLAAIKGVGVQAAIEITKERESGGEYKSLTNFIERTSNISGITRQTVENLIKAGAFDFTGRTRSQLLIILDEVIEDANKFKKTIRDGQIPLFIHPRPIEDDVPDISEYPVKIFLSIEKESLGLYMSGHPLQAIKSYVNKYSTVTAEELALANSDEDEEIEIDVVDKPVFYEGQKVSIVCVISKINKVTTRNKELMAFLEVEDLTGTTDITVFPAMLERCKDVIVEDKVVHIDGKINIYNGQYKIIANTIREIELRKRKSLYIFTNNKSTLIKVIDVVSKNSGDIAIYIVNGNWCALLSQDYWTNDQGLRELNKLGIKSVLKEE